jgi:predicted NodU family carbamoyl transferase
MNKLQQRIKSLLNEFKEQQENRYWYVATITFSTETFYRFVYSISEFYKRLSNSKTALPGNPTNREWWQKLDPNGFYDFTPNKDIIVLSFVMETKAKLNELEFKSRVKKIVPYLEISIDTKEQKEYEFELAFERILQTAVATSNSRNLVLMGGCALNCAANHRAFKYFDRVWIMPAPGDSGSSIGAVLADRQQHVIWPGPYLGYDMGHTTTNREIVEYITQHKICGLARDAAEFGPRALGNRSLIADPRGAQVKDRVNMIKGRESFRPFAPAILEEHADQYFEMPTEKTPYMQFTARCRQPGLYPAIIHVDGTSRVQTVNKSDNPEFRALLETWHDLTGCPMLLNTSLNIKGKPMVNDQTDRLNWQARHGLPVFN